MSFISSNIFVNSLPTTSRNFSFCNSHSSSQNFFILWTDSKIITTNSSGELHALSGANNTIPYINSAGNVTTHSLFTYDGNGGLGLLSTTNASINFDNGRALISAIGGPSVNLTFEVAANQTGTPDLTKGFLCRNKTNNNYLLLSSDYTTSNKATFNTAIVVDTGTIIKPFWGTSGVATRVLANTYGDSSSTTSANEIVANSFAIPTCAATTLTTYSALTNVYIAGAPTLGSNVTGNTYALHVNNGTSKFDGDVSIGGGVTILSGSNKSVDENIKR